MAENKKQKLAKEENEKTGNNKKHMIIAVSLLLLIAIFLAIKSPAITGNATVGSSGYDDFAECLTDNGAKMYGAYWCSHCQDQKKEFGKSFEYVDYIECTDNEFECKNAGITGYPTWSIDGTNYPGAQSFARLSELSGCPL